MTTSLPRPRAPYRIETERLVLRAYGPDDAEMLRSTTARCRDHLVPFMPWARLEPQTLDQKLELVLHFRSQYDTNTNFIMGIFDAASKRLIGGTGLHPRLGGGTFEIGYWITPENEGCGYISESVQALCRVGFDAMDLDLIGIRMVPENTRSERVSIKLGFTREGLLRRSLREEGTPPRDCLRYTLLREEYMGLPWRQTAMESVRAFDALQRPITFK